MDKINLTDTFVSPEESEGKFIVKKITKIEDLVAGVVKSIPQSDVTIQDEKNIIQLKFVDPEESVKSVIIKAGSFILENGSLGVFPVKFELKQQNILKSILNTKSIIDEGVKFFDKLPLYDSVKTLKNRPKKRSILICSPPGVGKSSAIAEVSSFFLNQDKGTCVLIWDTSAIRSSDVNRFFSSKVKFHKDCTKLIFIIEDINGGTVEDYHGSRGTDSSLLNLLEGVGDVFKIPTFIMATTNNPEQSVGALIDRPGRFDKVIELKTPNEQEAIELLSFISEKELQAEDIDAAKLAAKNHFSIAHLQEIVVRSLLDDKTFLQVTNELIEHKRKFKNAFAEKIPTGLGLNR
jgi:hypothetical protein